MNLGASNEFLPAISEVAGEHMWNWLQKETHRNEVNSILLGT